MNPNNIVMKHIALCNEHALKKKKEKKMKQKREKENANGWAAPHQTTSIHDLIRFTVTLAHN